MGGGATALIDCAFFVVMFGLILREIVAGKNWRNLPVAVAIGLFAVAHIAFYLEALDMVELGGAGQRLGLGVIAFMLTLIGGRIVPSFTANWLKKHASDTGGAKGVAAVMGPVDKAVLLITVPSLLAWVFFPEHPITGIGLLIAGPANLLRLARWRGIYATREPLVFVLHVGYGWLAISFALLGAAVLSGNIAQSDALHALSPCFTANWLKKQGDSAKGVAAVMGPVDKAVLLITVPSLLAWVFFPEHPITGIGLLIAGPANLLRLARWRGIYATREPLVFVLHVGYGWLAISFALLGAAVLSGNIAQSDALHALTVGAAGTMILAVMSRAILGHTGNVLHAGRVMTLAFCLVSVAALARLGVIVMPELGAQLYALSGGAWILAFALFVWRYGPISLRG